MFRLRTTTALSLLALAVGVAGTAWLSGLTAGWKGPERIAATAARMPVGPAAAPHRRAAPAPRPAAHAVHLPPADVAPAAAAPAEAETPTLIPIEMPQLESSIFSRRVARAGLVVLRLSVDAQGHVVDAAVDQSSGDPQLDHEAVQTVQGWRFAVPAGHPEGISGNLPMRFAGNSSA